MRNLFKPSFRVMGLVVLLSLPLCPGLAAKNPDPRSPIPDPPADQGPKFLPEDPVWVDPDQLSIPKPKKIELSKVYDLLENTFAHPGRAPIRQAQNINTLGEVPDSSWFTNRIGRYPMTLEQLARGPDQGHGPDRSEPWTIVSAKSQGITPGFVIRDGRGDIYFIKFDPLKYPQLATSAEVISTKFFYAFGYHVPENYLAFARREQFKIGPDVQVMGRNGKKRKMTEADVDDLLDKVPKRPDGSIQVLASLRLKGEPVGRFKYYGTRSDDPNDILPHEDRRELRGLRVFASWLNHNDSDATNSLDMYVTEADRSYIRHYLIDFGTTLGSGAIEPHAPRAGNEYYLEWNPAWKSAITLGLWDRPWRYIKCPNYPAVGWFESAFFQPERWRPDYPNPAHDRMQPEDAFWATRIVMQFSPEAIRAIVQTGQISDPKAENYLVETLLRRRDKILRYYLGQINPLDAFQVREAAKLDFKNLGAEAGIAKVDSYQYQWFRFDNQHRSLAPLGEVQSTSSASFPLPQDTSPYLMVRIRTFSPGQENWKKKVDVFIRNGNDKTVVGIEREN